MEPVRQPARHHPKSLHQKVGFINMIIYWDWYNTWLVNIHINIFLGRFPHRQLASYFDAKGIDLRVDFSALNEKQVDSFYCLYRLA
jgi:hypothetical protein